MIFQFFFTFLHIAYYSVLSIKCSAQHWTDSVNQNVTRFCLAQNLSNATFDLTEHNTGPPNGSWI